MNTESEPHDPATGEIIEGEIVGRAADGAPAAYAAGTLGELLNMAEDGQFGADAMVEVRGLVARMMELAAATGNKQKGSLTIKLDFVTEGDAFFATGGFKVTPPKETRRKTILWPNEKNNLSRSQPNQRQLFGVRQVGGTTQPVRRV